MRETSSPSTGGDRFLAAVDRLVARLENVINFVAGLAILALMFFVVVEVLGRRLLNRPIPGHIDWVELGMVTFAFLGVAYCQRLGGHVRMELIVSRLRGRAMWVVEALATLMILGVVTLVIKGSWDHFYRAWAFGDTTIDINLETWPSKLLVPIALGLLWLRLLLQLWGYLRLVVRPSAAIMAVPITLGLHEQAQREIEEAEGSPSPTGER